MPIYEFYCSSCHVVFNFLSRTVNTDKRPDCPRCGRAGLERQVSMFAISKGRKEEDGDLPAGLDEERMERAMEAMAGEFEGMDEDDPRQAARLMRRLYDATGMKLGPGIEEAIRRMEAGEDPDQVEQEMGDLLEGEDPFSAEGVKGLRKRFLRPSHDDTLYEL